MDYIKIAKVADFKGMRYRKYKILARNVAVFREPDGSFYAIEFNCKHQNWDLSTGKLEGDILTCPRHGWVYDVRTGDCLTHDSTRLRRYGLKVEGDDIYVTALPIEA
jgi:nitrite reductase/ring-hydroxylating ferredoxin subunit